ncbi:mucin-4-like [Ischnura elegans]|uniref:mucin-4-like n=1 Tax=Ischnura elegans TaxID=197161 RepID=UPI001ED86EE4|nr:mucin-4-like [Ischnura elegans]
MESRILILILGSVLLSLVCPTFQVSKVRDTTATRRQNNKYQDQSAAATSFDESSEPNPNQHEEDDYYQEFLGVPMPSPTDDFGVKGRPGIDFPNLAAIPITSFTCRNVKESGYFADMETKCQVFHICDGGRKMSFLCPNGTIFRQSHLICDWWFRVDCEDSQNYYEPSADTLRRDREKSRYDRLASESRDSMSITTNFRPHPQTQHYVEPHPYDQRNIYEPGQPLHLINRRISTVEEKIGSSDERNTRNNENRKRINVNPPSYQQKQQQVQEPPNFQMSHKKIVANFRSIADNGYSTVIEGSPKLVIEDGIIRAVKQSEDDVRTRVYFEPEDAIKPMLQPSNTHAETVGSQGTTWNSNDDDPDVRRADKMRRVIRLKVKSGKNTPNEGQILAETSSYASSHRRGLTQDRRSETVTFSQVTEGVPFVDINASKQASPSTTTTSTPPSSTTIPTSIKAATEQIGGPTTRSPQKGAPLILSPQYLEEDLVITYRPPSQNDDSDGKQSVKNDSNGSILPDNTNNSEDKDSDGITQPSVDEDEVVTYRPVMDLEKFLHQRREMLTKNDDKRDGKPYNGTRTPPILPLSSGPGAVRSLALYIESLGDDSTESTPRRIQGSLRGIVPTDPSPTQKPGSSLHVERESIYSTQKQSRQQETSKPNNGYETVTFVKYNDQRPGIKSKDGSKETYPYTKTEGNAYVVNGPIFHDPEWNSKDSATTGNKVHSSKLDIKKTDTPSKKMKDFLLGNFTSEDSGLFQHINKALSQSNSSLTKYSMETLFKNAIEPVLKEAMSLGSITESELSEILTTTENSLSSANTENPSYAEKSRDRETIQITPFFKVENGKVTSTSSKFPKDDDLSKTPSDLRELAQVFSRALSAYLEDPDTFRDALASVSHPRNPVPPIRLGSSENENSSNTSKFKEDEDEVLDFSDVQTPTTTGQPLFKIPTTPNTLRTTSSHLDDSSSPKIQTGFYITIPFITPTQKIPERDASSDKVNNLSNQDAEGPGSDNVQTATTARPEIKSAESIGSANGNQLNSDNKLDNKDSRKEHGGDLLEENLPPLETKILPPFQDPIPGQEGLTSPDEENGFTDINIPTAALDEILNEFVPEELNRLAMTAIQTDEIPDHNKYLSSYTDSLETNTFSTTDLLRENLTTTTPSSPTTTTITPTTDVASQTVNSIVSRITAKLPQMTSPNRKSAVNPPISSVSYDTYSNHLLKALNHPVTEKDESLVHAQSASFLPAQPSSNNPKHSSKLVPDQAIPPKVDFSLSSEKYDVNRETTTLPDVKSEYEFITGSTTAAPAQVNPSEDRTKIFNATEVLSLNGGGDDSDGPRHGNPRLVLLFVNDHNAKGIGLNEKNARLLKALLRKDDHQILRSVGLIPEDEGTREPTTSTTASSHLDTTSSIPPSRIILDTPSSTVQPTRTEPKRQKISAALERTEPPITTYAPKFTIPWYPIKKLTSQSRNSTARAEKLQATDPPEPIFETTTSINTATSKAPRYLPEKQTSTSLSNSTELLSEDRSSTVSDGRAFDLLRSLYSLTARWG